MGTYIPETCGTLTDGARNGGGLNGQDTHTGRVIAVHSRQDPIHLPDKSLPLESGTPQGVAVAFTASEQSNGFAWESDTYPTLTQHNATDTSNLQQGVRIATQVQWASGGGQVENDTAQALRANPEVNYQFARIAQQVRRLTPLECERLQGFPDIIGRMVFPILSGFE